MQVDLSIESTCAKCGEVIQVGGAFCPKCGPNVLARLRRATLVAALSAVGGILSVAFAGFQTYIAHAQLNEIRKGSEEASAIATEAKAVAERQAAAINSISSNQSKAIDQAVALAQAAKVVAERQAASIESISDKQAKALTQADAIAGRQLSIQTLIENNQEQASKAIHELWSSQNQILRDTKDIQKDQLVLQRKIAKTSEITDAISKDINLCHTYRFRGSGEIGLFVENDGSLPVSLSDFVINVGDATFNMADLCNDPSPLSKRFGFPNRGPFEVDNLENAVIGTGKELAVVTIKQDSLSPPDLENAKSAVKQIVVTWKAASIFGDTIDCKAVWPKSNSEASDPLSTSPSPAPEGSVKKHGGGSD